MRHAPASLITTRLRLRRPKAADADAIFSRYASDPEVTRFLGWPTHRSLADTRDFLAYADLEWAQWPAGAYLIESRETGLLLGTTGLSFESLTEAETGYVLARDAWGHGYATEALSAVVQLAPSLGVRFLYAHCHPDHRASCRVLEKAGFTRDHGLVPHPGFPNLPEGGPLLVLRYTLTYPDASRP
jgi:RimJ/RimL family protein N-acetyltransferase